VNAPFSSSKARSMQARRGGALSASVSLPREASTAGEAYRLSRIQAEGWNAANRIAVSALDKLDGTQIKFLNPYKSDPERNRWSTGFRSALRY
jgi:hypothetical protein